MWCIDNGCLLLLISWYDGFLENLILFCLVLIMGNFIVIDWILWVLNIIINGGDEYKIFGFVGRGLVILNRIWCWLLFSFRLLVFLSKEFDIFLLLIINRLIFGVSFKVVVIVDVL